MELFYGMQMIEYFVNRRQNTIMDYTCLVLAFHRLQ